MEPIVTFIPSSGFEWLDAVINWVDAHRLNEVSHVIALIIAVFGFGFSLIGIHKSKTAAEAAMNAANAARSRLLLVDTLADLAAAIIALEEIRRLHRDAVWSLLPERYSKIRTALIQIRTARPDMTDNQKSTMQKAIQDLKSMEDRLERALETDEKDLSAAKMNKIISSNVDDLQELLTTLKINQ